MPAEARDNSEQIERELFLLSFLGEVGGLAHVPDIAAHMAPLMSTRVLLDGEILYQRNEPSEFYYFVVSGTVELVVDGAPTWTFGSRVVVGAIDASLGRPHSRTARAVGGARVLALPTLAWFDFLADDFEVTRSMIRNFATRLHADRLLLPPDPPEVAAVKDADPLAQEPLNLAERTAALRTVSSFRRAHVQSVLLLASVATERRVREGSVLESAGDGGSVIVVVAGTVEATFSPSWRAEYSAGSLVGGPEALGGRWTAHEVRATTACTILRFDIEEFWDAMEEHFDLARATMMALSEERERLLNRKLAAG